MVVQLATRVDDDQAEEFRETTKKLGLSTADALRMFVSSFNEYQGFPYRYEFDRLRNRSRMNGRLLISLMICR